MTKITAGRCWGAPPRTVGRAQASGQVPAARGGGGRLVPALRPRGPVRPWHRRPAAEQHAVQVRGVAAALAAAVVRRGHHGAGPGAEQISPQSMVQVTGVRRRTPDGDIPAHASLLVRRPADPGAGRARAAAALAAGRGLVGGRGLAAQLQGVQPLGPAAAAVAGRRVRHRGGAAARAPARRAR